MIDEVFDVEPKFECTDQLPQVTNLAPQLDKICKEMEKHINRGEAVAIRCSEETSAMLYDYHVRKLLKPRVHRIKINTWEE